MENPMKELAKSMARFSWAMSMAGARQLTELVADDEDRASDPARSKRLQQVLDDATETTTEDFDERFQSLYEAGTKMQEELIEIACDVFNPKTMIDTTSRLVHRAADAVKGLGPEEDQGPSEGDG